MPATLSQIKGWIGKAQEVGATHMVVKCDSFDYRGGAEDACCYPIYVSADEDVTEVVSNNRDRTMEVYSFTGKHTVKKQLRESRARHFD